MPIVVAAVVRRGERYLLCRRPQAKTHGGLWEFPGGKVHTDESYSDALTRELAEELGVEAQAAPDTLAQHRDAASDYQIAFITAEIRGEPECREHEAIGWFTPTEIRELSLPPADAMFVNEFFRDGD